MNKAFYPGLFTPEQMNDVMGRDYWPVIITLNAIYGYQVAVQSKESFQPYSSVYMVNEAGVHVCSVRFNRMHNKKGGSQGDGFSICNVSGNAIVKSRNVAYINRAINTNSDLQKFLSTQLAAKDIYDKSVLEIINGYESSVGGRYFSCSSSQDLIMAKYIFSQETLDDNEKQVIKDLLKTYEREVYKPQKKFRDDHAAFFSHTRCAYVNVLQFGGGVQYAVGVINAIHHLTKQDDVKWLQPVKLYKSLHDVEEPLRGPLMSRLVMLKLRHKESTGVDKEFLEDEKVTPHFGSSKFDNLVLSRAGHSHRSSQMMLINIE